MAAESMVKCQTKNLIILSVTFLLIISKGKCTSKPITAILDAKWPSTSLLLEASEYLAKEGNDKFWDYVELTNSFHIHKTQLHQCIFIVESAAKLLSPTLLNLLEFSLSIRYYSPTIELFNQVTKQLEVPKCSVFIDIHGQITCDLQEAVQWINNIQDSTSTYTYAFDHVYPSSENNQVTAILYGEIGTESFLPFHEKLKELAKSGKIKYFLRHYVQTVSTTKVRLSGYGVELAVKNTEYKAVDDSKIQGEGDDTVKKESEEEDEVDGFLFGRLRELYPDLKDQLGELKSHLKEDMKVMAPLKVWQLQDLSFQAAQRVMSSHSSTALKLLRDLSQNLPSKAMSLVKTKVNEDLRKEIQSNQQAFREYGISPGDTEFFINGLQISVDDLNPFSLLDLLKGEGKVMDKLFRIGITGENLSGMLTMSVQSEQGSYAVDTRHDSVVFVNDLEKDSLYSEWPSSVTELLRPTFMGMLRYVAKNIFNVIIFIDPVDPSSRELISIVDEMVQNSMPIRFGIVLVTDAPEVIDGRTDVAVGLARAFYYIENDGIADEAFQFLSKIYKNVGDSKIPTADQVYAEFKKQFGAGEADEILGPDTDDDDDRKSAKLFFDRTGLRRLPQAVMNGVPLDLNEISGFEDILGHQMMVQTSPLQQAIYMGQLRDNMDVYKYIMERPNIVKRLNTIIQDADKPRIDLVGKSSTDNTVIVKETIENIETERLVDIVEKTIIYFIGKNEMDLRPITNWIIVDLKQEEGRDLLKAALDQMENSESNRVGIIYNSKANEESVSYPLPVIMEAILHADSHITSAILTVVKSLLNDSIDYDKLSSDIDAIVKFTSAVKKDKKLPGLDMIKALGLKGFKTAALEENLQKQAENYKTKMAIHHAFCKKVLNLQPGDAGVVVNGRMLAPLLPKDIFTSDDFELLETLEMDMYARKIRDEVDALNIESLDTDDDTSEYRSNLIMKISSALGLRSKNTRHEISFSGEHSMLHLNNADKGPGLDLVAVLDPLSNNVQKLIPVLMVLKNVTGVNMKIYMNSREKLSEMPLKRFYRYVLEPNLMFNEDGSLAAGPSAVFKDIPETPLLTMNLDIPQAWMVEAVISPYDLDNIYLKEGKTVVDKTTLDKDFTAQEPLVQKLISASPGLKFNRLCILVEKAVYGYFELEYILIEGHCSDVDTGQPPRGLQFTLGTRANREVFDTIVMANLGYFQLKAFPGSWILQLREGKSNEIYDIDSISGSSTATHGTTEVVLVDNFLGEFIKAKVKRKPEKQNADLLADDDDDEQNGGLWDSLSNIVGGRSTVTGNETINIFSVASGHLYERFLRIMILTVMKNTKSPVKFWFLKNYLSPTFQAFMPHMAKEYGFQYEFVQYKWPAWLHHQTEKQRVIWGYKILFLDVLFPLNLKKIIFVDADLIVRTDLKELVDLDLERAAYAYTPFCDSRTEMDGFRFWKQGYWRNHLGHRPYHISALYVIDLKRFKRLAAGDRLRGQYQGLSQDPNSLSNLDQDLPNNMIHQVPLKSLPNEWLWCETWCDDASKATAKTIDLCNNPLTKEPKLKSAVRIVKEWSDYDNEIRKLQERVAAASKTEPLNSDKTPDTHTEL